MASQTAQRWKNFFTPHNVDGILALIGGFSLHLTLGTLYCFGNLNTYITSYLRKNVHAELTYNDMVWVPTLTTVFQGLFMTCSGHLEERIGVQFTVALGCSIMVAGVLLTSITIRFSVLFTIFTYGCLFGLGTALAYAPPLGVAMKWFPKSKGLVNGIIVGGFGLGAFVFNQMQTAYLNPLNHKLDDHGEYFTDDKILHRVPSLFILLGSIYALIQALAILLIRSPPESDVASMLPLVSNSNMDFHEDESLNFQDREEANGLLVGVEDDGEDLELHDPSPRMARQNSATVSGLDNSNVTVQTNNHQESENVKPGTIVKTREFWILWMTFFFNTQAIGYINTMYKAYGQEYILDDHFLSVVGAIAAVFNASGRVFWGNMCDAYGYRSIMFVISMGLTVLYATFRFIEFGGRALFGMWVWGIFFFFCANFVLLPTATAQTFGTKYSSKNYGLVMTGQAFAAPITAILTEFVNPVVGWGGMFGLIAAFSCSSAIMNLFLFPKSPSPKNILLRLQQKGPSQL